MDKKLAMIKIIRILSEILINPDCLNGYNDLINESHISAVISCLFGLKSATVGEKWLIKLDLKNGDHLTIDYDANADMVLDYENFSFSIHDEFLTLFSDSTQLIDNITTWIENYVVNEYDTEITIND